MILQVGSQTIVLSVLFIIFAYLIGSIPFGLVIGKTLTGIDVREHGSKNIGTTNCIRVLGKKVGLLVFFFDCLKGAITILLVKYIFERNGVMEPLIPHILYGGAAILGHLKSIYLKFKGGKAVAVSLGVVLALTPVAGIAATFFCPHLKQSVAFLPSSVSVASLITTHSLDQLWPNAFSV